MALQAPCPFLASHFGQKDEAVVIGPGKSHAHSHSHTMAGVGKKQLTPNMGSAVVGIPNNKCPLQRKLEVERDEVGTVLSYS